MANLISELTVGLIQMDVEIGDCDGNASRAADRVAEAARSGVQLAVLPELWSSGYALDRAAEIASIPGDGASATMQRLARDNGVWIAGSILERESQRVYNTMVVCDPAGRRVATYRKTHLFGLMDEPRYLAAGDAPVVLDHPFARMGLAICYDLRFPQLFTTYIDAHCDVLLICAQWPNPRLDHWRSLLRARAIEGQVYVLACNRVGGSGTTFFGHSMIIDPWGDVVAEGDDSDRFVIGRIERARLTEIRTRFPFLADGRSFEFMETASASRRSKAE